MITLKLALRGAGCAAWLLVAAGCSSSASNANDFINQFVAALCHAQVECGSVGASEEARCRAVTAVSFAQDLDATDGKRVSFDSGGAGRCLDAVKGSGCRLPAILSALEASCNNVFVPQVAPGGICKSNGDCVGGACNTTGVGCAGTCVKYVATGGMCGATNGSCAATDVCDATSHTCVARNAVGASCRGGGGGSCQAGLTCRGYSPGTGAMPEVVGMCAQPGKVGDPCSSALYDCAPELFCDQSETPAKCAALLPKDAECLSTDSCVPGLACVGLDSSSSAGKGACTPYVDIGAACTAGVEPTNCPSDADCDPTSKVCVVTGALGNDCKTNPVHCTAGTYCDDMSGTCVANKKLGEACSALNSDEPCEQGLCDPKTSTCAFICM